jgi:malonate decarboxylase beta subunit
VSAFSRSAPQDRIDGLLDPGSFQSAPGADGTALRAGTGLLGGRRVAIAATDREVAGGAFGVADSQFFAGVLQQALSEGLPLLLCLDSAGARLDGGLPALGAFRTMYRHFLDLRLAGVPALALVGRDCFGGASMLAAAAGRRVYCDASRLAMSGPAVIQALGGRQELDADDAKAVAALMGGAARARLIEGDVLCPDSIDAFREAALAWLAQSAAAAPVDLRAQHNRLGTRLLAQGMAPSPANSQPELPRVLKELVPDSFRARHTDGVLIGRTSPNAPDSFFGFIGGEAVGALAAWTLAGECIQLADTHPGEGVNLLLDSPGQALTLRDERVLLSEYVAHLALVLSDLRQRGHRMTLQVLGDAAGGIYVALAAPAPRVVALPGAKVQLLPPAAIARVLGNRGMNTTIDDYLQSGVVDTMV